MHPKFACDLNDLVQTLQTIGPSVDGRCFIGNELEPGSIGGYRGDVWGDNIRDDVSRGMGDTPLKPQVRTTLMPIADILPRVSTIS